MENNNYQSNIKELAKAARSIAPTFAQFSQNLYELVKCANEYQKTQIELLEQITKYK